VDDGVGPLERFGKAACLAKVGDRQRQVRMLQHVADRQIGVEEALDDAHLIATIEETPHQQRPDVARRTGDGDDAPVSPVAAPAHAALATAHAPLGDDIPRIVYGSVG